MPRVDVIVHAVGETVGQHAQPATIALGATTFAAPTIKVSRVATPAHFTKSTTFGSPTVNVSGGSITHGDQMNATNTGYTSYFDAALGRNLILSDLVNTGGTTYGAGNNGQTITKRRFTDTIFLTGVANLRFEGCFFNTGGSSAGRNVTFSEGASGTNITFHRCTFAPTSGSVWYPIQKLGGSGIVEYCDISGGENSIGQTAGSIEIRYNFFHRPSIASNPSGHEDLIEVFGGSANIHHNRLRCLFSDTDNTDYCVDSSINVAPGATAVTVEDNFIDGGHSVILIDEQGSTIRNVKVRRNKMGGHTAPFLFGHYHSLYNNPDSPLPIVQTDAAQAAQTRSILWPSSGADINVWAECNDLSPNRNGQTVSP